MTAGAPRLHPRSVTDIIDATFSLYRRNFALFAGVVAVLGVPQTLLTMLVAALTPHPVVHFPATPGSPGSAVFSQYFTTMEASGVGSGIDGILDFLFGTVITIALARAVAYRYLGEQVSVGGVYRSLGARMVLRLLLADLIGLVVAVVALSIAVGLGVLVIVLLSKLVVAAALFGIVYFIAVFALAVYVGVSVVFVPQVIALNGGGPVSSFFRSRRLIRGYWWRVLGGVILLFLIVAILSGIVGQLFILTVAFGSPVLAAAITGIVGILLQPIQLAGMTLLYYDQRIRKEGFDLELALQANPV